MDYAIETVGLSKEYGSVQAVTDLGLRVPEGTVFGYLGPNGAGKTTTIRLLLGLLEPTRGEAKVLGFDVKTEPQRVREQAGALLEHSGLYERLSAEDNLELYGRIYGMPAPERRRRIRELLEHVGLWDRRGDTVGSWSRGMKQKLAVSRALLHRPRLVFMDEPTAGLDPASAVSLRDDLMSLAKREKATVFITTHNLAEAEKMCDRVAVINRSRLVAEGSVEDLKARAVGNVLQVNGSGLEKALEAVRAAPGVSSVELDGAVMRVVLMEGGDSSAVIGLLISSGARVDEARRERASLEDVFMQLTEASGQCAKCQ
jgi:ABC-2 type transport system ATP-binding protein